MIILHEATFTITQQGDGNDSEIQRLNVTVETCGAGPYLVLKTARWAMDQLDELNAVLTPLYRATEPLFAQFGERYDD